MRFQSVLSTVFARSQPVDVEARGTDCPVSAPETCADTSS